MRTLLILSFLWLQNYCVVGQSIVYDENAEGRSVADFTGLEVSGSISVYVVPGEKSAIAVSAGDEKFNSKIKTEVENGILKISVDGGMWNGFNWANKKLRAYVTVTQLKKILVSGASTVNITGEISSDQIDVDISGASEVKGKLNVNFLKINLSGASVARFSGKSQEIIVQSSGASRFLGYDINAETCNISASGASGIRVSVNKQLKVSASGGSTIYYRGNPTTKSVSSSGGARVVDKTDADEK